MRSHVSVPNHFTSPKLGWTMVDGLMYPTKLHNDSSSRWKMDGGKRKLELYSKQDNNLKFTKFKPSPAINQKNYYTDYLKRESQLLVNREDHPPPLGTKTVIIAPGSRNLRLGMLGEPVKEAKDAKTEPSVEPSEPPIELPMCIARKRIAPRSRNPVSSLMNDESKTGLARVEKDFADRMAHYNVEVLDDALQEETKFNSHQKPQPALLNKVWAEEDEVICNLNVDPEKYEIFWPIQNGTLNENYSSIQELYGDLSKIFNYAVKELLGSLEGIGEHAAVLVIPDLYEQAIVSAMLDLLVTFTQFGKVAVLQEAIACTFSTGQSAACVVSVGAQSTSITCVDDGMSVLDSRINLKYGGDDITKILGKLTSRAGFTLDFDLNDHLDLHTLDQLKIQVATTKHESMVVNHGSFIHSRPEKTEKYEFKLYNETMLPVLGLFYPQFLFDPPSKKLAKKYSLIPRAENIYDGRYDDPISESQLNVLYNTLAVNNEDYTSKVQLPSVVEEESRQETPMPEVKIEKDTDNSKGKDKGKDKDKDKDTDTKDKGKEKEKEKEKPSISAAQLAQQTQQAAIEEVDVKQTMHVPLDHAIIQSVLAAVDKTGSPAQSFMGNLMIIGGCANIRGFDELLKSRLTMWEPAKAMGAPVAIPVGGTPEFAAWRGACVYASLPIMKEMWIESKDWKTLGSRVLQYKALFAF